MGRGEAPTALRFGVEEAVRDEEGALLGFFVAFRVGFEFLAWVFCVGELTCFLVFMGKAVRGS